MGREAQAVEAKRTDRTLLWLLAAGHAVTDSYSHTLLAPLFPLLAARLELSLAQVGALPLLMGLTASLAQPLFGWISDLRPRWRLVAWGPLLAALLVGCVGRARSFAELGALLFFAGVGIAAFHPQGAALAREAGRGSGLAMSLFTVGGNLGFGLAPLLGSLYLAGFGLEHLYLAAAPAALYAIAMRAGFPAWAGIRKPPLRPASEAEPAPAPLSALVALVGTVLVRGAVQSGVATFLPFLLAASGGTAGQEAAVLLRGAAVSAFLLASAVAGPVGGHLADRFGRTWVLAGSCLLAPWPMVIGLGVSGAAQVAWLAAGAFLLMLPHPASVVLAQELLPRRPGTAASLVTGVALGLALLAPPLLGALAERSSLRLVLAALCLTPLAGALLVRWIPEQPGRSG